MTERVLCTYVGVTREGESFPGGKIIEVSRVSEIPAAFDAAMKRDHADPLNCSVRFHAYTLTGYLPQSGRARF